MLIPFINAYSLFLFSILISTFFQACNSSDQNPDAVGYVVEGTISGAAGKQIILADKAFYNEKHLSDTLVADSVGHFVFKGKLEEPSFYALTVQDANGLVDLILENSAITITGSVDSLWTAKVKGSKENDIHDEFIPFTGYFANQQRYNDIEVAYDAAFKAGDKTAFARMEKQKKELSDSFKVSVKRFIKTYPNSVTAVNSVFYIMGDNLEEPDSLLRIFESSSIGSHSQVKFFRKLIDTKKSVSVGSIAPDFEQPDSTGKMVKLSSFRNNYVLVDFWASWCVPCRQENPNLVKVYNRFHQKGFTILSVTLDDDKMKWLKAIQKDGLQSWTHVGDMKGWSNAAAKQYGVDPIPASLLLDPSGKIIAKDLRGEALELKIASLYQ